MAMRAPHASLPQLLLPLLLLAAGLTATAAPCPNAAKPPTRHTTAAKKPGPKKVKNRKSPPQPPSPTLSPLAQQRWSQRASWPNGQLPKEGDSVTIAAGKALLLDISPPRLANLTIYGTLIVARANLALTSDWILVGRGGRFQVGTASNPFTQRLTITLTGNASEVASANWGTKALAVEGGTLALYGNPASSWVKLGATAKPGDTQLQLAEMPSGWKVGDRVAIAPTDYTYDEVDTCYITKITSNSRGGLVTCRLPLSYQHWGDTQTFKDDSTGLTRVLDERAEVALLTRNIVIQGEAESTGKFGGHCMFMPGSSVEVVNVELVHMGQRGLLARYPLHFHYTYNTAAGSALRNNSIHDAHHRGVVIHRSHNITVEHNTVVDTYGHAYFLESGIEMDNTFDGNLAMLGRVVPIEDRVDPVHGHIDPPMAFACGDYACDDSKVTGFWISNSHNRFTNNVVTGIQNGHGFWFLHLLNDPVRDADLTPRLSEYDYPLIEFSGNVARTIMRDGDYSGFNIPDGYDGSATGSGFQVDMIYDPLGMHNYTYSGMYIPYPVNYTRQDNAPLNNCTASRCTFNGVWLPASPAVTVDGWVLSDNLIDITRLQGKGPSPFKNSVLVAGSNNQPKDRNLEDFWNGLEPILGGPQSVVASPMSTPLSELLNETRIMRVGPFADIVLTSTADY